MAFDHPQEGEAFLSTMPAGRDQRRHALVVVIVAAVLFVIVAPFARVPLPPAWAFVSIYDSALLVINLITAVLLFEQFSILRSRALLVLATGYLYAALMAVPHTLAFPGIFAPAGLLGDDPQTAAWIFVLWRVGWELTLVAYVFLRRNDPVSQNWSARSAIGLSAAMVLASTCLLTLLATQISHVLSRTPTRRSLYPNGGDNRCRSLLPWCACLVRFLATKTKVGARPMADGRHVPHAAIGAAQLNHEHWPV
jgi:hypothetical protein